MKKIAILILSILIAGLFVACNQDVTVDAQTYANMEVDTFVLNGQNYATLQEAVNAKLGKGVKSSKAAGDNDGIIYLMKNTSGPGAVIDQHIAGGVIIDFNNYTYSFTNVTGLQGGDNPKAETFGLGITNGADVTLRGLQQIDLFDTTTTDLTMVYVAGQNTKLTIEDAPKMKVEDDQYVFWAADGATLTIGSTTTTSEKTEITGKIAATGTNESKPVVSFNNDTKINASELKADSAVVVINTSAASTVSSLVASNNASVVVSGAGSVTVEKNDSPSNATYELQNTSSEASITVKKEGGQDVLPAGKAESWNNGVPQQVVNADYVAMIGSTFYDNVPNAFNAAESNQTVILLKDYTLPSNYKHSNPLYVGKTGSVNVTLDLNGKTVSTPNRMAFGANKNNTVIKNGIVVGVVTEDSDTGETGRYPLLVNNCEGTKLINLKVHGGVAFGGDPDDGFTPDAGAAKGVVVNGCIFDIENVNSGYCYALFSQNGSDVTIESGSFNGVKSGVTCAVMYGVSPDDGGKGSITVLDGSFKGRYIDNNDPKALSFMGGTFDVDPSDYVAEGYEAVKQGTDPETWKVVEKEPVARVIYNGSAIDYYSLKEAVDTAPAGSTVALLRDISEKGLAPISKTLTFDLSGHTWTVSTSDSESNDRAIKVENSADFTLIDSSEKHEGRIITESALYGAVRFESSGKLTIKNVTLKNSRAYGLNVKIMNGTYEIDGLTVYSTVGGSVEVGGKKDTWTSTGTIKNSTFIQTELDDAHKWISTAIGVSYGATVKVEGGNYIGTQAAVYIDSSGGNVIIDSGTFEVTGTNEHAGWVVIGLDKASYPTSTEHVTVNGGTFTGKFSLTNTSNTSEIEVFGGKYNVEPTDYLAEGYVARKTGENEWTVSELDHKEVEVVEDGVKMSLVDFAKSVNSGNTYAGKTVTLLKDVDLKGIEWTPIGTSSHPFGGTLLGNNQTIRNMTISSGNSEVGFIGMTTSSGSVHISDLYFEGVNIEITVDAEGKVGTVIGYAKCPVILENVKVLSGSVSSHQYAGGLVGKTKASIYFKDCYNKATITSTYGPNPSAHALVAAGILANSQGGNTVVFDHCINDGQISATESTNTKSTIAAGIFGYAYESGESHLAFIRCESNGQVTAEGQSGHSYKAEMLGSWGTMNNPTYSEIVVKDCKKGTSTITYENAAGSYDTTGAGALLTIINNEETSVYNEESYSGDTTYNTSASVTVNGKAENWRKIDYSASVEYNWDSKQLTVTYTGNQS